jgi:hypothetical protein
VYTWSEKDLAQALGIMYKVVEESKVEVYVSPDRPSTHNERFSRWLVAKQSQYADSVYVAVDSINSRIYHLAGLGDQVKQLYQEFLPYQCQTVVRNVTPEQAELLNRYNGCLFAGTDTQGQCHMDVRASASSGTSEMVVWCTQRVEAAVIQECDMFLANVTTDKLHIAATDTDLTLLLAAHTPVLGHIEVDNKVTIKQQGDDVDDVMETESADMYTGTSYCVDISDKVQLRLVEGDLTDVTTDVIVSTVDEHGRPNTALAKLVCKKGALLEIFAFSRRFSICFHSTIIIANFCILLETRVHKYL